MFTIVFPCVPLKCTTNLPSQVNDAFQNPYAWFLTVQPHQPHRLKDEYVTCDLLGKVKQPRIREIFHYISIRYAHS